MSHSASQPPPGLPPPSPRPAPLTARSRRAANTDIALALGGGGARGLAHVLMLEVFDELGVRPSRIAGTSIGALYGAAYASGLSARHIRALTEETLSSRFDIARQLFAARSDPVGRLLRLVPLRRALLDPQTVLDMVLPKEIKTHFEDLEIPLEIVTTDLGSHDALVLDSGVLKPAIAASIAIPVLFSPVSIEGRTLVDGGLVSPLPLDLIAGKASTTVAIDVGGAASEAALDSPPTMIEMAAQSLQILQKSITRERLRSVRPDIYIEVDLDRFGALDFLKAKEILVAAQPAKELLKRQLDRILSAETVATREPVAGDKPGAAR